MAFNFVNSDWRAGMQAASEEIDEKLGEDLIIMQCVRRANFSSEAINGKSFDIRGIFSLRSETVFKQIDEGGITVQSRKPIVSFSHGAIAALPWAIRVADRVQRRCDGTIYEVTTVQPDGVSRVTCDLKQLGLPSLK